MILPGICFFVGHDDDDDDDMMIKPSVIRTTSNMDEMH
jgi:hypothetical protein